MHYLRKKKKDPQEKCYRSLNKSFLIVYIGMTDLVPINLEDENSQAQISYYSDLTLGDLANYLEE